MKKKKKKKQLPPPSTSILVVLLLLPQQGAPISPSSRWVDPQILLLLSLLLLPGTVQAVEFEFEFDDDGSSTSAPERVGLVQEEGWHPDHVQGPPVGVVDPGRGGRGRCGDDHGAAYYEYVVCLFFYDYFSFTLVDGTC